MARTVCGEQAGVFGSYTSVGLPQFAPAVPASGTPVANNTGQSMQVVITGGTMTAVVVNGVQVGTGAGTYTVPDFGAAIVLTYTVAPTWAWSRVPTFLAAVNANGTPVSQTGVS